MANLRTNSLCSVLEWDPVDQPYQRCVIGYTINLNGTVYNTTNTSLSLAGESLSYCETQTVTVTPLTLNGLLSPDTSNITVINRGACNATALYCSIWVSHYSDLGTPALSASFTIHNEVLLKLQIMVQVCSYYMAMSATSCLLAR